LDACDNIPLFDVEGYPVNLSYNGNPSMDEEASWVGLGWNLNPGAMTRDMRGIPDEFNGDKVEKEFNIRPNFTAGATAGVSGEFFGVFGLGADVGVYYNNYRKWGYNTGISPSIRINQGECSKGLNATIGSRMSYDSQTGADVTGSFGLGYGLGNDTRKLNLGFELSTGSNSRTGLKDLGLALKASGRYSHIITEKSGRVYVREGNPNGSVSAAFSFARTTYFPTSPLPYTSNSIQGNLTVGAEAWGAHPNMRLSGYYNVQELAYKKMNQPAYGYLHSSAATLQSKGLMDYNRDAQLVYREDMINLPVVSGTYDLFSASGQGMGAQFRASRNDVGIFRPANSGTVGGAGNISVEVGAGGLVHLGGDNGTTENKTWNALWSDNNALLGKFSFTEQNHQAGSASAEQLYEPVFFKSAGEPSAMNSSLYSLTGKDEPFTTHLENKNPTSKLSSAIKYKNMPTGPKTVPINGLARNTNRVRRNQLMTYLTSEEAAKVGLSKKIFSYPLNTAIRTGGTCNIAAITQIDRTVHPKHHISEVSVLKEDGSRYVYGIPAYNLFTKEVAFRVAPGTTAISNSKNPNSADYGLIPYTSNVDNTIQNTSGKDHFFDSKKIPKYAHSYLLTGVLSPDYVDKTGDGITNDDAGSAIRFNYTRTSAGYKWRAPVQQNRARYQPGYELDKDDDQATYAYGEKELWYTHSIESKNILALFYMSPRMDGLGVLDENGGKDVVSSSQKLMRLDSIQIIAKPLSGEGTKVVLKTVHFEYSSNELCKGVPNHVNNNGGKLTLEKVWFTYAYSQRGVLNAYKFNYKRNYTVNSTTNEFNYSTALVDRWGNYKQHPAGMPNNDDFPYALQDPVLANAYVGAWTLNTIDLPSGSRITVDFEPDDYAYVQDKRAGQMFKIKGFVSNGAQYFNTGAGLKQSLYDNNKTPNRFVVLDIPPGLVTATTYKRKLLEDIKELYFKFYVKLLPTDPSYDFVQGYVKVDIDNAIFKSGTNELILPFPESNVKQFKLFKPSSTAYKAHPVTIAGLQALRLNIPDRAFDDDVELEGSNKKKMWKAIAAKVGAIRNILGEYELGKINTEWVKQVDVSKSYVRLASPTYQKFGGGLRVKQVTIQDNWNLPSATFGSAYGQTYEYKTKADVNGTGTPVDISSGVAAYEPNIGGEENMMKEPISYRERMKLAPDNRFYTETPIGEGLYPAPIVGYSEVKVRTLNNNFKRTGTGYTITKFYTARDFPVKSSFTSLSQNTIKNKPSVLMKFLKISVRETVSATQGFAIEVNDMHGKMKEEAIYDENGALVTSTKYEYFMKNPSRNFNASLSNEVPVFLPDGTVSNQTIGVDMDLWQEMAVDGTSVKSRGIALNVESFLAFIFPTAVPVPIPIIQNSNTQLRTSISTKFIKKYGILKSVTKTENGSSVKQENLLFDAETGDVLLTRTQNEFDDPVYQFTYPAHFAYKGMELAYKNINLHLKGLSLSNGNIVNPGFNVNNVFMPGDECLVIRNNAPSARAWFVRDEAGGTLRLVNENGVVINKGSTSTLDLKVIRSGRRNQASAGIGAVTSRLNPIVGNTLNFANAQTLQASATEFKDNWQLECTRNSQTNGVVLTKRDSMNPYRVNLKGNWRPFKNYIFYSNRTPGVLTSTNIRTDGAMAGFYPFWNLPANSSSKWTKTTNPAGNWTLGTEITQVDFRGNDRENKDAIGVFSAEDYVFNRTMVGAVGANAPLREMYAEAYEDYFHLTNCLINPDKRLNLINSGLISGAVAHTGKSSYRTNNLQTTIYQIGLKDSCEGNILLPLVEDGDLYSNGYQFTSDHFKNNCDQCLATFMPLNNKKYTLSAWMATDSSLAYNKTMIGVDMQLRFLSSTGAVISTLTATPGGMIIDGWKRLKYDFTIPANAQRMEIIQRNIQPANNGTACYMDDFRIHPFEGTMKAYAYDNKTYRLMATLDENNYATFYEYDDEGLLIRVKRETDEGIVTVQENRTVLKPNNN
jgi:hypothetical protein